MRLNLLNVSLFTMTLSMAILLSSCATILPTGSIGLAKSKSESLSQVLDKDDSDVTITKMIGLEDQDEEKDADGEKDTDGDGVIDSIDACPGTPNNVVVDEHGCPRPVEYTCEGMDDNLHRLIYGTGVSELDSKSFEALDEFMSRYGPTPVSFNVNGFDVKDYDIIYHIESHTSKNEVADEYALSKARAETLKQILIERYGVDEQAFKLDIHTSDRPIAPNDSAEGRRLNQRIYMRVTAQLKTASK